MGTTWTKEQEQVINIRDKNILVSAAAGSGKTAVLVERIIGRLTRETPAVDVDRLLVVTYTEAAAAEMKERIGAAIEKALNEQPDNTHLKKQSALIHTAKITTIHSFCLSVIKEYFHTINLDPGFRIAEEGELKLLKQDVMQEMLEARYEEADEQFLQFVESFATGREDARLEEIILTLYEFAGSYPEPEEWLDFCAEAYESGLEEEGPLMRRAVSYIRKCMEDVLGDIQEAKQLCLAGDGPYMYTAAVESDEEIVERILRADGYEELFLAFGGANKLTFARLAANRDKTIDEEKTGAVKELRERWKKTIGSIKDTYFFQEPKEMRTDMQMCRPVAGMLTALVKEFQKAFAEKKASRGLIDFRDMEQFALRILTRVENGKRVPSEAAEEYQEQFVEVMIDEYQDSNLIQEAILTSVSRVGRGENNLFMVGDVKQSIYRFRLSRPELFMEKYHTYSTAEEGDCRRIDLHKNFRSRREVLDSANAIFRRIMTEGFGGIAYDDNAALYVGASYEEQPGNGTEVLVIEADGEELEGKKTTEELRELEARASAARIHRLMEQQKVWDKEAGRFRPMRYSDIVILTRSLKGWTDVFARVLAEEGIPAFAGSKEGYFETLEIGWMLDYLRVLDNYRQDIPLTAVLKSPFGGLSNEELAEIRNGWPQEPFYLAVRKAADLERVPDRLQEKLREILAQMDGFRERVPYTAIHELLEQIVTETGYRNYVAAMPAGEQRLANLEMLLNRAKAFESTSYKGLFHFVRYIGQLQKYDVDYGEAGIYDEKTNAVRLMSIHKSKGLEFPVVIVAGMGKQFNTQDVRASVVLHPELGIGIDAVDIQRRTKCPSLLKKVIQTETGLENLAEELRVLYVALTRAKEKLIMIGTASKVEKMLEPSAGLRGGISALPYTRLTGARSYYDWVLPAVAGISKEVPITVKMVSLTELDEEERAKEEAEILDKDILLPAIAEEDSPLAVRDKEFAERLSEQFSYQYPYEGEAQLKLKFTVSELKKRAALVEDVSETGAELVEEADVVPLIPDFLQEEEELKGASRGSAYHRFLELLDFTKEYGERELKEAMERFRQDGRMSQEEVGCIRCDDMLYFLNSRSGRRMQRAARSGKLHKEQPFVFGVDAREIYPETDADEVVLIQGIIDVYFEEEDGITVLDYKTDRVADGRELVEKYQEQLHLYGRALQQMTEKPVKEKIIYSFSLREEIGGGMDADDI